ncbi:hypothetical protein Tco_1420763 [Tanacetum coccineum]
MVPETPLPFGVAERLSRTFRADSTGIRAEAPKMMWADSVSTAYLIYRIPYVLIGLHIPKEEWRGKDTSLTHLKVFSCDSLVKVKDVCGEEMKCTFIGSGSDEMRYNFWDTKSHQSMVLSFKNHSEQVGALITTVRGPNNSGSFKKWEDQMKNTLSMKEEPSPKGGFGRLHGIVDPTSDVQGSKPDVFLSQNISRKEGITNIVELFKFKVEHDAGNDTGCWELY